MLHMDKRATQLQSVKTCALLRQMAHLQRQRARFSRGSTPQDKRRATHHRLRRRVDILLRVLGVANAERMTA